MNVTCSKKMEGNNGCNLIEPAPVSFLNEINPITNRTFTKIEKNKLMNTYKGICNSKEGTVNTCCDPNSTELTEDFKEISNNFLKTYPKFKVNYKNEILAGLTVSLVLVPAIHLTSHHQVMGLLRWI